MKLLLLLALFTQEASPTPYSEVIRVIDILPKPEVAFVDYGCGSDARWCIVAAAKWKCRAIGIELDPSRVVTARECVNNAGLQHLVTIIEGDATTADVNADVGVAYLYTDTLVKLKITKHIAFASYIHQPAVAAVKNGNTWIYTRPTTRPATAVWGGVEYTHRVCNDPNCAMCNSIQLQLTPKTNTTAPAGYHYETQKICYGRFRPCEYVTVLVKD